VKYPIDLRFKLMALANQVSATDADGNLVCYVKQKMFKLKEHVNVFTDLEMKQPLCDIKADRVIDWSAKYTFTGTDGTVIGHVARSGGRSLWKAHYEIFDAEDNHIMKIREENPWSKFFDGLLGQIPVINILTGMWLHPKYLVSNMADEPIFRITKQRAFFEGKFTIDELKDVQEATDMQALLAMLMMLLLERTRG
jgi:uncharacterized protein YxjI